MHICMDWQSINFDWNRARAFLVTAEEGSLSAAARALGLTQPTLGRQGLSSGGRIRRSTQRRRGTFSACQSFFNKASNANSHRGNSFCHQCKHCRLLKSFLP